MNRQGTILSAGADLDRSERFEIADPISQLQEFPPGPALGLGPCLKPFELIFSRVTD
jgi:hypothetical protein